MSDDNNGLRLAIAELVMLKFGWYPKTADDIYNWVTQPKSDWLEDAEASGKVSSPKKPKGIKRAGKRKYIKKSKFWTK